MIFLPKSCSGQENVILFLCIILIFVFYCKFSSKLCLVAEDITTMESLKSFSPDMLLEIVGAGDA